jgi:hypothetical protein
VNALGATAGAQWLPIPRLAFRLSGGARAGSVPGAQATTLTAVGTAGIVLYPLLVTTTRWLGVWIRGGYLVEYTSMTHLSADEPHPATRDRVVSGIEALAGIDWRFASNVGVVAGVGGEDVFSTTYVYVRGQPVATLVPLRGLAELGVRICF